MAMNEKYPVALAVGTELTSAVTKTTYRIIQVLGQGGFGITYKAELPTIGTKHTYFAIKEFFMEGGNARQGNQVVVLPGKEAVVQSMKERYWREAERLKDYNHPHIVKIADWIEANNTLYYVMDFLPGGSLDAFKQPMEEKRLARYIIQVAEALQYLHSLRVNHLDVKPENIMLDEQDNAILIDFGISQGYTATGEKTTTFSTRGVSKGYSAPEYAYEYSFSPALDVYSLGATLYRLATGNRPPVIQDVEQLTFPASVSSRLKSIIKQAMHHRVDKRSSLTMLISSLNLLLVPKSGQFNDSGVTKVEVNDGATRVESVKSSVTPKTDPYIATQAEVYLGKRNERQTTTTSSSTSNTSSIPSKDSMMKYVAAGTVGLVLLVCGYWFMNNNNQEPASSQPVQTTVVEEQKQAETTTAKQTATPKTTASNTTPKQTTTTAVTTQSKTTSNTSSSTPQQSSGSSAQPSSRTTTQSSQPTQSVQQTAPAQVSSTPAAEELSADELLSKGLSSAKRFNYDKALNYFKQAAEKGNVQALYYIGDLYYNGNGVDKSFATAKRYFEQAANKGFAEAQYMMGVMYRNGQGVTKSILQAKSWLQKAANQGHVAAERLLDSL